MILKVRAGIGACCYSCQLLHEMFCFQLLVTLQICKGIANIFAWKFC